MHSRSIAGGAALFLALAVTASAGEKIPVTSASAEAKKAYLEGRDLFEKLRATDARKRFEEAVAKDPGFALAWVGLANTSGTAKEFFDALDKAVPAAAKASEGERLLITALDAGARSNPAKQEEALTALVAKFPDDERAHNQKGLFHFGRQEYAEAVAEFKKATTINPEFSQPYNMMGYGYRFLNDYPAAEAAFKQYIATIPNDPNPYDSYAELLMKMGRYEESIKNYEKALAVDPNFVASWVGIGNNHMFMGHGEQARQAFAKLTAVARNDGEKRQALFWNAMSYVHEGATDKAVAEIEKEIAISKATNDLATISGDYNQIGDILLEAGRADEALAKYKEQVATMDKANVPADVKEATRRQHLFDLTRVAIAKKDMAGAQARAAEYATAVAAKKVPFELWQSHELNGRVALAEQKGAAAVAELKQANQQDPRVLYLLATAHQAKGDAAQAKTVATQAADFNALSGTYGYVRGKAKAMAKQ